MLSPLALTLRLCACAGVRLEDQASGQAVWKLDDPAMLMAERSQKQNEAKANALNKVCCSLGLQLIVFLCVFFCLGCFFPPFFSFLSLSGFFPSPCSVYLSLYLSTHLPIHLSLSLSDRKSVV